MELRARRLAGLLSQATVNCLRARDRPSDSKRLCLSNLLRLSAPLCAACVLKRDSGGGAMDAKKKEKEKEKGGRRNKKGKVDAPKAELTAEQKLYLRTKYEDEQCTKLVFLHRNGQREELFFETRMTHYSELLRLIAKVKPRCPAMFVCQFPSGEILTSQNFTSLPLYRVREMATSRVLSIKYCPRVDTRWDFLEHHAGPPPRWVDRLQLREEAETKAKNDVLYARIQEESARKLMERLESGGLEEDDGQWDDL